MPLVYDELHWLAHQQMKREQPGNLLQTSALINEAYLRLVDLASFTKKPEILSMHRHIKQQPITQQPKF